MKPTYYIPFVAAALVVLPANAAWQRIGGIDKRPTDLASASVKDVSVTASSGGIGQPENLLSDNVADATRLDQGTSAVTIRVHRQADLSLVSFINDGVAGKVSVAASSDSKAWAPLGQAVVTAADRSVVVKFATAQARYLRLEFDLAQGGAVRSLSVFGSDTDNDFPVQDSDNAEGPQVNVGGGLGGTRVIYVDPRLSGSDDDALRFNRFDFPESEDRFRTIIYDLGRERTLTEVGSVHSARPVRFYAYTYRDAELPEKADWRGRMSFDPASFETIKPVAVVEDSRGSGYIKARLANAVMARYVALRWEPDFNPPGFGVMNISVMASSVTPQVAFQPGGGTGGKKAQKNDDNKKAGAAAGEGNGEAKAEDVGDAARRAVTNPFSFTAAGALGAGSGGTSTGGAVSSGSRPNSAAAARPRPRPRPVTN
jgi:hypothetical protein